MLFYDCLKQLLNTKINIYDGQEFLKHYESLLNISSNKLDIISRSQFEEVKIIYSYFNLMEEIKKLIENKDLVNYQSLIYNLYNNTSNPDNIIKIKELSFKTFFNLVIDILKIFNIDIDKINIDKKLENDISFVIENNILKEFSGTYQFIEIPENVKEISQEAFYNEKRIISVIIPDSVKKIGEDCFSSCINLKYVSLSDNVIKLEEGVFNNCQNLEFINLNKIQELGPYVFSTTKITFNEEELPNLISIGSYTFAENDSIEEIKILKCYENISKAVFSKCSNVKRIIVGSCDNFYNIFAVDKSDFNKTFTKLEEIIIYTDRLYDNQFTGLMLPVKIKVIGNDIIIGNNAFKDASGITDITFEGKVVMFGEYAFSGCTNLVNLSMDLAGNDIPKCCFSGCKQIVNFDFLINSQVVIQSIGQKAFYQTNLAGFDFVRILERVSFISSQAFDSSIGFPNELSISFKNIKKFEPLSLKGVTCINKILIPSFNVLPEKMFYKIFSSSLSDYNQNYHFDIVIVRSNLVPHCFENHTNIKRIKIGNSDNLIAEATFKGCKSLECVDFFNPISNIALQAFDGCSNLSTINSEYDNVKIGAFAFRKCKSLELDKIFEHVSFFGDCCFEGCSNIVELNFNRNITDESFGRSPFVDCSNIKKIKAWSDISLPGLFISNRQNINDFNKYTNNLREIVYYTNTISNSLFAGLTNIERVTIIGENIEIGKSAFEGCLSLHDLFIQGNVISLGVSAFKDCYNFEVFKINFVGSIIPDSCFENCSKLDINISFDNVKEVGSKAFFRCNLTTFDFENNLRFCTKIGTQAFDEAKFTESLININLLKIDKIETFAFKGIKNINKLTILSLNSCDNEIASILSYNVNDFNMHVHINVLDVLSPLSPNALLNYHNIDEVLFNSNGIISNSVLEDTNVEKVTIRGKISALSDAVFKNCTKLNTLVVDNIDFNIGKEAFSNCVSLENIIENKDGGLLIHTLDDFIQYPTIIGYQAFLNTKITNIMLNPNLTELGDECFAGCSLLTKINMRYDKKINSFYNLFGKIKQNDLYLVNGYYIPKALNTIIFNGGKVTDNDFNGLEYLENIEFRKGATFEALAFKGCIRVNFVYIDKDINEFDTSVFKLFDDHVQLYIDPLNETFCIYKNSMYSIDYQSLYYCFDGQKLFFNPSVQIIETGAIRSWNRLESLKLYLEVEVKPHAITNLFGLKSLTIDRNCVINDQIICYENDGNHKLSFSLEKIIIDTPKLFPTKLKNLFCGNAVNFESVKEIEINNMEIGKDFFEGFTKLNKLTFNGKTKLSSQALNYLDVDELIIASTVALEKQCFGNMCAKKITMPRFEENENFDYYCNEGTQIYYCLEEVNVLRGKIYNNAFASFAHLSKVSLEKGVSEICVGGFNNVNIDELILSSSVKEIEDNSFIDAKISNITLLEGSSLLINEYGLLINNGVVYYAVNKRITDLILGEDIRKVTTKSLQNLNNLKNVKILNDKIIFEESPFDNVKNIKQIEIGELTRKPCDIFIESYQKISIVDYYGTIIPSEYFKDFISLETINLKNPVIKIASYAFSNCKVLPSFDFSNNVEEIGDHAFINCQKIKKIIFGSNIRKIGSEVFNGLISLEEIVFDNNLLLNQKRIGDLFGSLEYVNSIPINQNGTPFYFPKTLKRIYVNTLQSTKSQFENIQCNIYINKLIGNVQEASFINCQKLSIKDANEVISVGNFAFMNSNIEHLELKSCVKIQAESFAETKNLNTLIFDSSLESINFSSFKNSSLKDIIINNNEKYTVFKNLVIDKPNNSIIYGLKSSQEKEIILPDEIKEVSVFALDGMKYLEKFVGLGLEALEENALSNCPKLKEVILSKNLLRMSANVFQNDKLDSLTIPFIGKNIRLQMGFDFLFGYENSCNPLKKINMLSRIITKETFKNLTALQEINLSQQQDIITTSMFENCQSLQEIIIPENVIQIESSAFKNCISFKEFNIPWNDEIKYGEEMLNGCKNIFKISIPYIANNRRSYPFSYFIDKESFNIKDITINSGSLIESSFMGYETIESIDIHNLDIQEIPNNCFKDCPNLKEVLVPKSIRFIGDLAFSNCMNILEYPFNDCIVEEIGAEAFANCCKINKLIIPDGIVTIGSKAFSNIPNLNEVILPNSLVKIGDYIFEKDYDIKKLSIPFIGHTKDDPIEFYELFDDIGDNKIHTEELNITNDTIIKDSCFENDTYLLKVTINNVIGNIGQKAWGGCEYLKEVTFKEKIQDIPDFCFCECFDLETLNISGVKQIGDQAFYDCGNLKSFDGSEIKKLGVCAFMNSGLLSITIGGNLKTVPESCFEASDLGSIELPQTTEKIDHLAFSRCTNLSQITIPVGVKFIGSKAFFKSASNLVISLRNEEIAKLFDPDWNVYNEVMFVKKYYKNINYTIK